MKRCSSCLAVNNDRRSRCYDCGQLLDNQNTTEEPDGLPIPVPTAEKPTPEAPEDFRLALEAEEKNMNKWLKDKHLGCLQPFGLIYGIYSIVKSKHPVGWKIAIFASSLLIIILILMVVFRELNFVNLLFPWA